jgi:hypothetical protein
MTDLVETFIIPLEAACLPYVITGSVAAMAYGEPRLTNDIDLILELNASSVSILESAFPEPDYYRPPTELILIETARNQRGHFNLIHNDSMLKADVYLVSADPLHRWALARRRRLDLGGVTASFAPPEYVILRKLQFYKEGGSAKHVTDIRSMLSESGDVIDFSFVEDQADRLGLKDVWNSVHLEN